jgi:AraC family transcriptional regulator
MNTHNSSLRKEYQSRINRVMDYIDQHLDEPLDLNQLAEVAYFSPYHFHRIFRAMVGEPLKHYIKRVRLEKAAILLKQNAGTSVTEVALNCGYNSSAAFARAFKEFFGVSASDWRKSGKTDSKNGKGEGKEGKAYRLERVYLEGMLNNLKWKIKMNQQTIAQVEVKDWPETHLAYIRHVGPYQGDGALFEKLFGRLMQWAGPRNLLNFPETKMMSVYHDDPKLTDDDKLRLTVAITVPEGTAVDGEIGYMTLPAGKHAIARFELLEDEYAQAWEAIYKGWLPESGYQPADSPAFELYHNSPDQHPEGRHIVDICVPVVPM